MDSQKRILIVEDEADLADLLTFNLQRRGYVTDVASDGAAAIRKVQETLPDLVVLDVMLPKMSGLEVARHLRTQPQTEPIPILMLTARSSEGDQVGGLEAGADDYVTKPFSIKILCARIEALLRRTSSGSDLETINVGPLTADLAAHQVSADGEELKLTLTEFKLLASLMRDHGRAVTRRDLVKRVMGPGVAVTARTIDVHVAALRKKLGAHGQMIQTVRGVGYKMLGGPSAPAPAQAVEK